MVKDMERENRFLGKDISIKRKDDKWVRGICVSLNDIFITLRVNPNKEVSIPWQDVKEIISPAEKPLERWKND